MNKKCMGCGNILKDDELEHNICNRCFRLKHYGEYHVTNKDNRDYLKIINNIASNDLVIYVTSLLNLMIMDLSKFKNVIVVLTKRDILPKSVKDNKIIDYVKNHYNFKDIEVISSIKNYNLDNLISKIEKYNKKKVYLIGNTNSGKSTLLNKLIENYSESDIDITTSMYPSTTLDTIEVKIKDIEFIDTPGIIDNGSVINYIDYKMLKKITPKKEVKPRTYQIKGKGSLVIEDLVRIDYETNDNSMTIYIANSVNILRVGEANPRLKDLPKREFNLKNDKDIVITDLCFIKFVKGLKVKIYANNNINVYERDNLI